MIIKGRLHLIHRDNKLIADIDTDQIFHNSYLHITDIKEMAQYAFSNLEGYKDFFKVVSPGDIIAVGKNFGSGSSRQQAVDCFRSLGIKAIIGVSFGAIYWRNAINAGLPLLQCKDLQSLIDNNLLKDKITVEVNFERGELKIQDKIYKCLPLSSVELEIVKNGGLLEFGRK